MAKLTGPIVEPELPSVPKIEIATEKVELRPYEGPGGGHHVPAKSAFTGNPIYDINKALAIPNEELERLGIDHRSITTYQMKAYSAFAKTGKVLTWDVVSNIETNALEAGNTNARVAKDVVNQAINSLKKSGIDNPTRIPWGGK